MLQWNTRIWLNRVGKCARLWDILEFEFECSRRTPAIDIIHCSVPVLCHNYCTLSPNKSPDFCTARFLHLILIPECV